jgi:HEPN domain-containing protein
MKRTTAEWVETAEEDRFFARQGRRRKKPAHSGVCFHCQQCAEKYLKALLEELGFTVPKTHDLGQVQTLLLAHHVSVRGLGRGLKFLTGFAVTPRYPGDKASKRQAAAALRWMERVPHRCRTLLGIRPRRRS